MLRLALIAFAALASASCVTAKVECSNELPKSCSGRNIRQVCETGADGCRKCVCEPIPK